MTILIKGAKMPESCKDCPLCAGIPLGSELVYHKCLPLDRLASKRSRRGECPLVEVPTPHGRLIDADAIFEQWYQLNFDRKISDGTLAYWNVLLGKTPTVIEGEQE